MSHGNFWLCHTSQFKTIINSIIIMDGGDQYFYMKINFTQKSPKWYMSNFYGLWIVTLKWHCHNNCKLVGLMLHNSCSYIIVTKLHKLYMYTHAMSYICCNSCNLFDDTHACRIMLSYKWWLQLRNPIARLVANHPIFS
jgi:hypothetical protein